MALRTLPLLMCLLPPRRPSLAAAGLGTAAAQQQTSLPGYDPHMVLGPGCDRLPDSIRQMLPLMPAPAADQLCPTLLNGFLGTCDLTAMVEYGLATALPEMTLPLICKPAAQVGGQGRGGGACMCGAGAAPALQRLSYSGQSAAPHSWRGVAPEVGCRLIGWPDTPLHLLAVPIPGAAAVPLSRSTRPPAAPWRRSQTAALCPPPHSPAWRLCMLPRAQRTPGELAAQAAAAREPPIGWNAGAANWLFLCTAMPAPCAAACCRHMQAVSDHPKRSCPPGLPHL